MSNSSMINLLPGFPKPSLLPKQLISDAVTRQMSGPDANHWLEYDFGDCSNKAKETFSKYLTEQYKVHDKESADILKEMNLSCDVKPRELFFTSGASGAVELISGTFGREGDLVILEEPTYFLAAGIFKDKHQQVLGFPSDQFGLDVDYLEKQLAEGKVKPKFVYLVPTFSNPSGKTLPASRRKKLCALAHQYDFYIVADEVYQLVFFAPENSSEVEGEIPLPFSMFEDTNYSEGRVFSIGSLSKVLAPGIRVGYIHSRYPNTVDRFAKVGVLASGGCTSHFNCGIACSAIETGTFHSNLLQLRESYRAGKIALCDELNRQFKSLFENSLITEKQLTHMLSYTRPNGGYFIWINLPNDISEKLKASSLRKRANQDPYNINFMVGNNCAITDIASTEYSVRLCFAYYDPEVLQEFARLFGKLLSDVLMEIKSDC